MKYDQSSVRAGAQFFKLVGAAAQVIYVSWMKEKYVLTDWSRPPHRF
jgi:hypothetical protein